MLKVSATGYLAADAELRYTTEGKPVVNFRIGVSTGKKNKEGGWDDKTDWFRVTVMRGGELLSKKLLKGTRVYFDGPLQIGEYEAKDGSGKRISLDVFADNVEVQIKSESSDSAPAYKPASTGKPSLSVVAVAEDDDDSELPF